MTYISLLHLLSLNMLNQERKVLIRIVRLQNKDHVDRPRVSVIVKWVKMSKKIISKKITSNFITDKGRFCKSI